MDGADARNTVNSLERTAVHGCTLLQCPVAIGMGQFDLIVRGGSVVRSDRVEHADIAIADGTIVEVGRDIAATAAVEIEATGLHLFPSLIDAHVHFNEPGRTDWEGWAT